LDAFLIRWVKYYALRTPGRPLERLPDALFTFSSRVKLPSVHSKQCSVTPPTRFRLFAVFRDQIKLFRDLMVPLSPPSQPIIPLSEQWDALLPCNNPVNVRIPPVTIRKCYFHNKEVAFLSLLAPGNPGPITGEQFVAPPNHQTCLFLQVPSQFVTLSPWNTLANFPLDAFLPFPSPPHLSTLSVDAFLTP
jgi:hypothetical protein